MSIAEAEKKRALFAAAERALGRAPEKSWYVPGRIEVLGKHTDYAGGPSLVGTVERGMCAVAAGRGDATARVVDASRQQTAEFPLSADIAIPSGWANYVATVVRRVARNFPEASRGVDIAFASDLPHAAGLSSSSALVVAIFTAIADANRLGEMFAAPEDLAAYLACIENGQSYRELAGDRGVGTFGGSEDHTAILCCRAGELSEYRFCPVDLVRRVAMPSDWIFVIASSGVKASKAGAARERYNRASLAAAAVLEIWNRQPGRCDTSLNAALCSSPDAADHIRSALRQARHPQFSADDLLRRFEHFVIERVLVAAAADAFAAADAAGLGALVDRSQLGAEQLLGNQVPETVALARSARELGAIAASAFGAGFGGSVWALTTRDDAERFLHHWRAQYASSFPGPAKQAEFFLTHAGPGMTRI
jgi:galactokinase